jgi:carboxylesterase type B
MQFSKDPQPPEPWIETLNCTAEGPNFWGVDLITGEFSGSFDSLHVNVYSNNIFPETPYPVMVYIHGGSYMGFELLSC